MGLGLGSGLGLGLGEPNPNLTPIQAIHSAFNIGYMFFRASALPLVDEWLKVINEDRVGRWDQGEFGRIARIGWDPSSTAGLSDPRLFWAYHKKVVLG